MDPKAIAAQIVNKHLAKADFAAASWNPLTILQDIATYFQQNPEAKAVAAHVLSEVFALLTDTSAATAPADS